MAAVCNSITDIQLYFNGVVQNSIPTDGTSGATTMIHDFGSAEIGDWSSDAGEFPFQGEIDELRVWDTARTVREIQQHMCSKVSAFGALVGYWRGEGPLSGPAVTDYSSGLHNGTIVGEKGAVTKVISGAPVGDYSKALYGPLEKRFIALADRSGDSFKVSLITGNPFGVSVYCVDEAPQLRYGLSEFPSHYFGVFCADSSAPSTFRISYHYSEATLDGNPESDARIFEKETDSSTDWTATGRKPDTTDNLILKNRRTSRGEFILSFVNSTAVLTQSISGASGIFSAFPNPAHNYLVLSFSNTSEPVNVIRIVNLTGEVIREIQYPSNSSSLNLDIANWSSGIYFAEAITAKGNYFARFIIQ